CDWSSDVCSSDLAGGGIVSARINGRIGEQVYAVSVPVLGKGYDFPDRCAGCGARDFVQRCTLRTKLASSFRDFFQRKVFDPIESVEVPLCKRCELQYGKRRALCMLAWAIVAVGPACGAFALADVLASAKVRFSALSVVLPLIAIIAALPALLW